MLCGCIPIGSDVAAIPAIISTHGFVVARRDDTLILETVQRAIAYTDKETMSKAARNHIIHTFGEGKRANALYKLFDAGKTEY